MPMTMIPEGVEELQKMLKKLGDNAQRAAATGLYDGAGVMADEIKDHAKNIPTAPFHYAVFPPTIRRDVSPEEKEVVQNGIGIARFNKSGGGNVTTSVGYGRSAGYAMMAGRRKPIPLIANAINSGTSFMRKQPFFRHAVSEGTRPASEAMQRKIEDILEQMTK